MEKFTFKYESYGFGSATVRISAGTQMVAFNASYIGRNPLEDILEALPEMVFDEYDHCQLHWLSEPGVLRLTIKAADADAHILVEEFDQDIDYRKVKDAQWVKKLETVIPFTHLVAIVVREAERNLQLHGLVGFSEDWCDHTDVFPISAYLRLKGIKHKCDDDDLMKSPLEKELSVLNTILSKGHE